MLWRSCLIFAPPIQFSAFYSLNGEAGTMHDAMHNASHHASVLYCFAGESWKAFVYLFSLPRHLMTQSETDKPSRHTYQKYHTI